MYGDDDDSGAEDGRPLSFLSSPYAGDNAGSTLKQVETPDDRLRLVRTTSDQNTSTINGASNPNPSNGHTLRKTHTLPARISSQRSNSYEGPKSPMPTPLSPSPSLRDVQADSSGSQFPLTNIDNPNDIAQELSNLQALRRMSMDVGNQSDPDLLPFSTMSLMAMPAIAPTGDDDEADPSRLLWVPARVHPELEPTAFKNFLENRVNSMKRRSGDSMLSVDGMERSNSTRLSRKKSMLSRQINTHSENGDGYTDGAERIQRQYSLSEYATPELSLDELVRDPTKAVQKLAQDAGDGEGDMPILPVAPGMGLQRSKRTQYRKGGGGSIRHGERAPFSKRVARKQTDDSDAPPVPPLDPGLGHTLTRVQSEPAPENFSRPTRSVRRRENFSRELVDPGAPAAVSASLDGSTLDEDDRAEASSPPPALTLPIRSSSAAAQRQPAPPVPQIVETPPDEPPKLARQFPERSSSQSASQQASMDPAPVDGPPARSNKRPSQAKALSSPPSTTQTHVKEQPSPGESSNLNDMANRPSPLPGGGASSTSSLTFIPTFTPEKSEKKAKDKDDTESITSTKSSSGWKWFKSDDKEKKKREKEEQAKKLSKGKTGDKHDNARLDVLQSSIDNVATKGRESVVLDRDSIDNRLQEERKKDSRKASDSKKEKDGFFGGLFGGSKKKGEKDPSHKKKDLRPLTPEPPPRQLRADVDYPWTRFPIIEERAIYRMAHIKLANPRRPLHSQVLLSNFMYSYLAKVQAMHPQLNVPISPQQKRQEEERKRREAEQALLQQQQQQQQMEQQAREQAAQDGNFDFEYHRSGGNQYGDAQNQHNDGSVQYVDDAQIYEYEHDLQQHEEHVSPRQNGGNSNHHHGQQDDYGHQGRQQQDGYYYNGRDSRQYDDDDENNDMW
ncbi:hypothetical protein B0H66DRAFT_479467 [Apodospora peruviana]|uniref:Protein Zds1 C-terminal domain-containing protein n=1 Tax=Apodospora peruviana TaxID=516989 RepID=A0AAE0I021_9PEZI|nr:hypothetical protein B0H66DRAFT_479467 [Apodospora peruviana]